MNVEFIILGFIVGVLIGVAGVGGASILTPSLIFMGIPPVIAIGTDFLYNSVTKAFGTMQHLKQKTVNIILVKYFSYGSLPAAIIANFFFHFYFSEYYNESLILLLLGIVLVIISFVTLLQIIFNFEIASSWKRKEIKDKKTLIIVVGIILGVIVGVTSIGAGSIFALFLLYFFNLKSPELVGTDITHAFILTTMPGILMVFYGNIDFGLLLLLLSGSIPGTIIGSKLTLKLSSNFIRFFILIIIFITGLKLIYG